MFEPNQDHYSHSSPSSSSSLQMNQYQQQPPKYDQSNPMMSTNNDQDDQQFFQDLLTMETLPSSSSSSSTINSSLNHYQFKQNQELQQNQEYQLQTSSTNSNSIDLNTTTNSSTTDLSLLNQQQVPATSSSGEPFLLQDYDQTTSNQNLFTPSQDSSPESSILPTSTTSTMTTITTAVTTINYCNFNRADSSSHSSDYSPKMKILKSSSNNSIDHVEDPMLTTTTHHQSQSTFHYVDSLMDEYHDNDGGNDSSDVACHDFLTNLEVDDTKVVVDQFIASTTTTMEDVSTSMITSSEDILPQTKENVNLDSLVNDTWFQQNSQSSLESGGVGNGNGSSLSSPPPPQQPLQSSSLEESAGSGSSIKSTTSLAITTKTIKSTVVKSESKSKSVNHNNNKSLSSGDNQSKQSLKNLSPTEAYLSCVDQDEVPRHTICPLCDNPRSFCSSSSVTRHIRSVHKLTDLTESKYCYCILCHSFQEDINAYYQHLKQDHQFDLQKNFPLLFTKRNFQTIEEFQIWKEQELEQQTGCRYERCFSYDYPRSIYFKCSGIQIQTMKNNNDNQIDQDQQQNSTQLMVRYSNNQNGGKIETADLSKIVTSSSKDHQEHSDLNNNNSISGNNNTQMILKIENQNDARMYPCPSSVRLIFRKNHIQINYIPFHLGHVLTGGLPPPTTTCVSQQSQSSVSNHTSTLQRASPSVSVPKTNKKQQQNQMVQTTTCSQVQQQNFLPNNGQHQMVAIAAPSSTLNQNHLTGLTNIQLATNSSKNTTTQLVHFPVVNLVGGNLVLTAAQNANNNQDNPATFHVQIAGSSSKATVINRLQHSQSNVKNHFVQTQHDVSTQSDILSSASSTTSNNYQFNFNSFDGQSSSTLSTTSNIAPSPVSLSLKQQRPIMTVRQSQQAQQIQQLQVRTSTSAINDNNRSDSTYQQRQQQSYHPADSSSSSIDGIETVTGSIITNQNNSTNGLVIVSLEKGMEMVQERFRPRKEQLRYVFEQLLNACFTESDFDLLESSLASISNHSQLNPSSSTSAPSSASTSASTSTSTSKPIN